MENDWTTDDWMSSFLEHADRVIQQGQRHLRRADCVALDYVMRELRALIQGKRTAMPLVLLAGYIALGQEMCRQFDSDRLGIYILAGRALDAIYEHDRSVPFRRG